MSDWLAQVRGLPRDRRAVQHVPETPRYVRAGLHFDYLLAQGSLLGSRPADTPGAVEIALWAPPPDRRGHGFYSCIRLFLTPESAAVFAVLYCFWDGTEGSRGFRSLNAAASYAREEGFDDEHQHAG